MRLPNAENAFIPDDKLYGYCLSEEHPYGKHKAFLFKTLLEISYENAEVLRNAILEAVLVHEAIHTKTISFGKLYTVDFPFERNNRSVVIRSGWIFRNEEDFPRLTTCFIL